MGMVIYFVILLRFRWILLFANGFKLQGEVRDALGWRWCLMDGWFGCGGSRAEEITVHTATE